MIHNWEDISECENGDEWDGTIPIIKHRRKLLKEYMEAFPISALDGSFCLRHYVLLSKKSREKLTGFKTIDDVPIVCKYDGNCQGCLNCCSKLKKLGKNNLVIFN